MEAFALERLVLRAAPVLHGVRECAVYGRAVHGPADSC